MSMHLQRFVDRVRGAEARGAKDNYCRGFWRYILIM